MPRNQWGDYCNGESEEEGKEGYRYVKMEQ